MNKTKKFLSFLESLKTQKNAAMIESVKAGYMLLEGEGEGGDVHTKTIAELEAQGFEGQDVDLATSLFEYRLAWKKGEDPGYVRFIYKIGNDNRIGNDRFDWSEKKEEPFSEAFDWAEESAVSTHIGEDVAKLPFIQQVIAVFDYYGAEETFGTSYSGGFKIADPNEEVEVEEYDGFDPDADQGDDPLTEPYEGVR